MENPYIAEILCNSVGPMPPPVIDGDVERGLRGGIRHRGADRLKHAIEAADLDEVRRQITEEELEAARDRRDDLTGQVERCRGLIERSRTWVGF